MNSSDQKKATQNFVIRRASVEALASSRGVTFGGAGASLALILLIAQIGVTKTAVAWSLGFASAAFPLWLSLALSYDVWLALKLDFEDLYATKWLPQVQVWWFFLTGLITFIAVAFLVFSLQENIGVVFICASLVGLIFVVASVLSAAYRLRHHMVRARADQ